MSGNEVTFVGVVVGIVIGAGGTIIANLIEDLRKRQKIHLISTISQVPTSNVPNSKTYGIAMGISVDQGQFLQKAYVLFNGKKFPWYENGKFLTTKKLSVGENPSLFYPYLLVVEYVDDISSQPNAAKLLNNPSKHGLLVTLREEPEKIPIFTRLYELPNKGTSLVLIAQKKMSKFSVRIIDDNITRTLKFDGVISLNRINIGKLSHGVPNMDTVDCEVVNEITLSPFGSVTLG